MTNMPTQNPQPDPNVSRAIQCTNCQKTFMIGLADGGKDIHFLNMISWNCPACKQHNLTPFLTTVAS